MSESNSELAREVTLFRFSVLAELLHLPPGSPERAAALRPRPAATTRSPAAAASACCFAHSLAVSGHTEPEGGSCQKEMIRARQASASMPEVPPRQ